MQGGNVYTVVVFVQSGLCTLCLVVFVQGGLCTLC